MLSKVVVLTHVHAGKYDNVLLSVYVDCFISLRDAVACERDVHHIQKMDDS